ncbi:MAG: hypothetical protein ABI373_02240 [Flavobacteriales bacterium]
MTTYPRLYEPSVYRFAWPVAMLMLLGWVGLLALGKPVPIWLEGLAAANLYLTANCHAALDLSGGVRHRAMTLSAQWFFAVLIAIWFTFTIASGKGITFHARALVLMVLGFSAICEAVYAFMRKDELGMRWLVGLLPIALVAVLTLLIG